MKNIIHKFFSKLLSTSKKEKKAIRYITDNLEISSDDADEE